MTHETHRCSVDGCPSLAAYEVRHYDFDAAEGAVRFERDETCSYLCVEHAVENEQHGHGMPGLHTVVPYPHTNRDRRYGLSLYFDLPPADAA
jgi:hypothetical protein